MKASQSAWFLCACLTVLPVHAPLAAPQDVILMLDNSGSMRQNDPEFLTSVAVRRFIQEMSDEARVGILAFDQDVRWTMPMTPVSPTSRPAFIRSLDSIDYAGQFTDSPKAMERAIYELKEGARPGSEKTIVFMTDGIVDTGDHQRDLDKARWMQEDLAAEAAEANIRIFGIAFTDNADFQLIQALSRRTGGDYFRAFSASDIDGVFRRIVSLLEALPEPAPVTLPPTPPSPRPALTSLPPEPVAGPAPEAAAAQVPATPELPAATTLPEVPPAPAVSALPGAEATVDAPAESATAESAEPQPVLPTLSVTESPDAAPATDAASGAESGASAPTLPVVPTEPADAGPAPAGETAGAKESAPAGAGAGATAESSPAPAPATAPDAEAPTPLLPASAAVGAGIAGLGLVVFLVARRRGGAREAPATALPKAFLNDLNGSTSQSSYELTGATTVVGRLKGADDSVSYVVIDEATIGRRHAIIEYKDHSYWVADQSSLNGTFVNNRRIEAEQRLKHGDRLRFHKHEFEFLVLDMFETDRTMVSETVFAGLAGTAAKGAPEDVTEARVRSDATETPSSVPPDR